MMLLLQATVVHDVNAIDHNSLSDTNSVTIADEAMNKFRKGVSDPLKAVAALKQAGKQ